MKILGAKKIIYGAEAREKLLEGIDAVANAVKVTLGPAARTVVLEKSWGSPSIINDGVTIAKDIELGDPFANMGAKLIQEVASKTQDNAGDGTSTASILAQSLCHHGLDNMQSGSSPVELKAGFDEAISAVVNTLKDRSVPVETSATIKQVATCLMVALVSTGTDLSFSVLTTAEIASSNPAFNSTGLEPDCILSKP